MRSRILAVLTAFVLISMVVGSAVADEVWDLTTDYSDQGNPTWPWSYGWEPNLGGAFQLYTYRYHDPSSGMLVWTRNINVPGGPTPSVWKNKTSSQWWNVKPGEVSMHPGYYGEYCLVRWTSPVSGQVALEGLFGGGDIGLMSVYIQHNGVTIWSSESFTIDQPFSFTLAVSRFDNLDFLVGNGYGYGNTPIHATITYSGSDLLKISGKVTESGARKGISDVNIAATSGNQTVNGVTGAKGAYSLDGLWTGTYKLVFSKDGYRPTTIKKVVLPPNRSINVELKKKRSQPQSGRRDLAEHSTGAIQ